MRRELTIALAWMVCLAAAISTHASLADAQDKQRAKRPYPPGLSEALLIQQRAEALGLSEETLAKLQALINEGEPIREKLQQESGEALAKLQELLDQPLPEEEVLRAASNETGDVARRFRDERLRVTLLARGLLTEEQRAQYMEIRSRVSVSRQGGGRR